MMNIEVHIFISPIPYWKSPPFNSSNLKPKWTQPSSKIQLFPLGFLCHWQLSPPTQLPKTENSFILYSFFSFPSRIQPVFCGVYFLNPSQICSLLSSPFPYLLSSGLPPRGAFAVWLIKPVGTPFILTSIGKVPLVAVPSTARTDLHSSCKHRLSLRSISWSDLSENQIYSPPACLKHVIALSRGFLGLPEQRTTHCGA